MLDLESEIEHLIRRAIDEDVGTGDITSMACLPDSRETTSIFVMKQSGVIAGLPLLPLIYKEINPDIEITFLAQEGSYQKVGSQVAKVTGSVRGILTGERVALNMLQHASGVATITAEFVRKVANLRCDILDTRMTLPGLRPLEKYAVAIGGGKNHRNSLDDCGLIKASHLAYISAEEGHPISVAIQKIREINPTIPIEIQIDSLHNIEEVLKHDFRAILLRNMSAEELYHAIQTIRQVNNKVYLAYTGVVSLETIRPIAETGINGISVCALTHSVQGIDIGLRLK